MTDYVIEGDYKNNKIKSIHKIFGSNELYIEKKTFFTKKKIPLTYETIESYELVNKKEAEIFLGISDHKGPTYTVSINFKDGKRSLVVLQHALYLQLTQKLY